MENNARMKVYQANSLPAGIFNCIQITVKVGASSSGVFSIRIAVCYHS